MRLGKWPVVQISDAHRNPSFSGRRLSSLTSTEHLKTQNEFLAEGVVLISDSPAESDYLRVRTSLKQTDTTFDETYKNLYLSFIASRRLM